MRGEHRVEHLGDGLLLRLGQRLHALELLLQLGRGAKKGPELISV